MSATLEEEQHMIAKIDNVKNVATLLKAVFLRETAVVVASADGLKVTVEESKCLQANAFIQAEMFQVFVLTKDSVCFKINLSVWLDCLSMLASCSAGPDSTALEMRYAGRGHPLVLLLEDNGVLTDCSIETQTPEATLDFCLKPPDVMNKVIIRSECMKDTLYEMDGDGELVNISFCQSPPHIEFSTIEAKMSSTVRISGDSDMVELFQCRRESTSRYRHAMFKLSAKPLSQAQKVSLRIDDRDFLCLQYMIRMEDGNVCFVEFYCSPEED